MTNAEYIRGRYFDWLVRQLRDRRPRTTAREYAEYTKPLPELVPAKVTAEYRRQCGCASCEVNGRSSAGGHISIR